jgi:peptide/nickel transport system substrate-binding protein
MTNINSSSRVCRRACGMALASIPPALTRCTGLTLGLLLVALTASCAERHAIGSVLTDEQVPESERFGGTVVIGIAADVVDINPLTAFFLSSQGMQQHLLFMPLVAYDEKFEPGPRLARSWDLDEAAGTLTFHLRDDVFWHDGVRTTAHDMQFTYERARDPGTAHPNVAQLKHYGEAEVLDSLTWRVRLRPHWQYLDVWTDLAPVPRHLLEHVRPEDLRRHSFSTTAPVGNGPFRFVERRQGVRWVFEANPGFPLELGGRPYLDRVVFRVIPEQTTLLTELLVRGIDFYYEAGIAQAERIQRGDGVRLLRAPGISWVYLGFNQRRPPFDDLRVRRALTIAIDREQIVGAVWGGFGPVANTTISPLFPHHDPTAGALLRHDPERALALLAEAGFRERGADGVLRDANGRPLRFTIKVPQGYQERHDAGQMIQSQLRRIGVDARLQSVEFNTLVAELRDQRDFDAVIIGWTPGFQNNDVSIFGCNDPAAFLGYCNARTEALLDSVMLIPGPAAAKPLWSRYQRLVAEELPMTFLLFPDRLNAAGDRLRGARPDARGAWVGIERWWLDPAMREEGEEPERSG